MRSDAGKSGVIFDFDGVLADTQSTAYRVVCRMADRKKIPHPSLESLKNSPTEEIMSLLQVKWWQIPFYLSLARKWAVEDQPQVQLFPWSERILATALELFQKVWIVSSNSSRTIEKTLLNGHMDIKVGGKLNMELLHIQGDISIFGKSTVLKKIVRKEGLEPGRVAYVGDETRDIQAARSAGIRSICVTWGYQSESLLRSLSPDFLIKTPEEADTVLRSFA